MARRCPDPTWWRMRSVDHPQRESNSSAQSSTMSVNLVRVMESSPLATCNVASSSTKYGVQAFTHTLQRPLGTLTPRHSRFPRYHYESKNVKP